MIYLNLVLAIWEKMLRTNPNFSWLLTIQVTVGERVVPGKERRRFHGNLLSKIVN
jgi:hypothetical protein